MKTSAQEYIKSLKEKFAQSNVRELGQHSRRDWYTMIGIAALVLVVLFTVGIFTLREAVSVSETRTPTPVYRLPLEKSDMEAVADKLRIRTTTFDALRVTAPEAPDPDGDGGRGALTSEEALDEEETIETLESEELDGSLLPPAEE